MIEQGITKVLIVDDFATVRRRLIAMLSEIIKPEDISQVEDSPGAIDSIRRLDTDAVIPDIGMPGDGQMDVLLEVRSDNQTLPVIAPTDYAYRQYRRKYVGAGAGFFFDKLTQFDGLMAVLGPLLGPLRQILC